MISQKQITKKLGLNISGHNEIDFIDINFCHDTELFLDPCLIECCNDDFSQKCSLTITDYFEVLYSVFKENNQCEIRSHLSHLGERNEAKLGYGNGRNGKAKTAEGMQDTLLGLTNIIQYGCPMKRAIDIPLLMPRFAEDCMSDMLMNILYKHFSEYTIQQCHLYGIPTSRSTKKHYYWEINEHCWKVYEGESLIVDGEVILLIPKRYVCKKLYYSTGHFFMSKIAPLIQKRDTVIVEGKEIRPTKKAVKRAECKKYGSLLNATLENIKLAPHLLNDYHYEIPKNYSDRILQDDILDEYVYGNIIDIK